MTEASSIVPKILAFALPAHLKSGLGKLGLEFAVMHALLVCNMFLVAATAAAAFDEYICDTVTACILMGI